MTFLQTSRAKKQPGWATATPFHSLQRMPASQFDIRYASRTQDITEKSLQMALHSNLRWGNLEHAPEFPAGLGREFHGTEQTGSRNRMYKENKEQENGIKDRSSGREETNKQALVCCDHPNKVLNASLFLHCLQPLYIT